MNEQLIKASIQYSEYLSKHVGGVRDIFHTVMMPVLIKDGIDEETLASIEDCINTHDASKYGNEEFAAYRNHFYMPEKYSRSSDEYNKAWLHHQNHNPHHWQYYCLINDVDEPQIQPLDMPFKYIIEMLCDWESAGRHYGNTAYDWYEKQKDKMILSKNTRDTVEKYIRYFKE